MAQPVTIRPDVASLLLDALEGGVDLHIGRRELDGLASGFDADADLIVLDPRASRDEQAAGLADALAALIELDAVPRRPTLRLVRD